MQFVGVALDNNGRVIIVLREPCNLKNREEVFRLHKLHQPEIALFSITINDIGRSHHELYDATNGVCMVSVTV